MAHHAPPRKYYRFHPEGGSTIKKIMAVLVLSAIVAAAVVLPERFDSAVDEQDELMIEEKCHTAFADDETSRLCTDWVARQFDDCFESKDLTKHESPAPHRTYDKLTPKSDCRQELIEQFANRRGEPIVDDL